MIFSNIFYEIKKPPFREEVFGKEKDILVK